MILEAVVSPFTARQVNWTIDSSAVWRFNTSVDLRCPSEQNANLMITTPRALTDEQKLNMTKAIAAKVGLPLTSILVRFYSVAKKRAAETATQFNVAITFFSAQQEPQPNAPPVSSDASSNVTATEAASLLVSLSIAEITTVLTDSVEGVAVQIEQPPSAEPPPSSIVAPIPPPEIIVVSTNDSAPTQPPSATITETASPVIDPLIGIIVGSIIGGIVIIVAVVCVAKLRDRIATRIALNAWFNRKRRRPLHTNGTATSVVEMKPIQQVSMEPAYVASLGAAPVEHRDVLRTSKEFEASETTSREVNSSVESI